MNRDQRLLLDGYMKRYTMREGVMMFVMIFIMSIVMVRCRK